MYTLKQSASKYKIYFGVFDANLGKVKKSNQCHQCLKLLNGFENKFHKKLINYSLLFPVIILFRLTIETKFTEGETFFCSSNPKENNPYSFGESLEIEPGKATACSEPKSRETDDRFTIHQFCKFLKVRKPIEKRQDNMKKTNVTN